MRSPHEVQQTLRTRGDRALSAWLAAPADAAVSIPLHPPTAAEVLADSSAVSAWIRTWQSAPEPLRGQVRWETRRWAQLGAQRIPVRWEATGAQLLSRCAGAATARDWGLLESRYEAAVAALAPWTSSGAAEAMPDVLRRETAAAVTRTRAQWLRMTDVDADLAVRVAAWVLEHPASGLRIRQVPLPGMHTKWLKDHRTLVGRLVAAARADGTTGADPGGSGDGGGAGAAGGSGATGGADDLGLAPAPTFHDVLVLDPRLRGASAPSGPAFPRAFRIDLAELPSLGLAPDVVIVCENSETVQVLPDLPGVVALSGSGYAIPGLLSVPWVQAAPVLYWGDLDADGFRILDRARHHHPRVRSVLMDRGTAAAHRALSVPTEPRTPATTKRLTDVEQALHADFAATGERLEQERIEIGFAVAALRTAVGEASA